MSITIPSPEEEFAIPRRHWTREEFHRAADLGLFRPDERLELIAGDIVEKITQNRPHAISVIKATDALEAAFGAGYTVQQQLPLVLAADGEPEPDALVIAGTAEDYPEHPTQQDALLLVEVSDTTLAYDRGRKLAYYAEAGIADYWIVNLGERCLEVYRQPVADASVTWGWRYQDRTVIGEAGSVSPLAAPGRSVPVTDLLPRLSPSS